MVALTTIVHLSCLCIEITAAQTRSQVMGTFIVQGIRHILLAPITCSCSACCHR
jgi:hypothetical protein